MAENSAAARAGLAPGDEFISINEAVPRDVIEYQMLVEEPVVHIEVQRGQFSLPVVIEKSAGEPLGAEVDAAIFDQVRTCDNHCAFCFIYQLPKGMRKSLYLKDDDYRLSFLYGNFTTLTRFTELDLERVVNEKLSPLYVSIHSTDPEIRADLLRNQRGATSLRWLRALLDSGIEVHGQVVVCPGINDGAVLHDTFAGVLDEYPDLASIGVVPLGVSDYSTEDSMRAHTAREVEAVLDAVHEWQELFLSALGKRMVFASDEYYVLANENFPKAHQYDGFPQHENGIGIARAFLDELNGVSDTKRGVHSGFFSWVDGAPAEGYRAPRINHAIPVQIAVSRSPISILTGSLAAPVLSEYTSSLADVNVAEVTNTFFGGNIGVAGLMTATDINKALVEIPENHQVLLPDVCLSNGLFLDGKSLKDLDRSVEVIPTNGTALRQRLRTRLAA